MSEFTIAQITAGIIRRDETFFNIFYQQFYDRLYRYMLVLARGNEDLVKDVMQEVMLRVIRYIKTFNEEEVLWKWLTRIAYTTFIDEIRKRRKTERKIIPLLEGNFEYSEEQDCDLILLLQQVVEDLSTSEKLLIDEYYHHGKSHKWIAQNQNTTAKAVESKLSRIRKKMKKTILERLS